MSFLSLRTAITVILMLAVAGCGSYRIVRMEEEPAESRQGQASEQGPANAGASEAARPSGQDDAEDPQLKAAREQAEQMLTALGRGAGATTQAGPPVRWIDARRPDARDTPTRTVMPYRANAGLELDAAPQREPQPQPQATPQPASQPAQAEASEPQAKPAATPIDHRRLARVMMHQLRHSDDPALKKAIDAAALSVVSGDGELDPEILATLEPRQRDTVRRFHVLMRHISDRIAERGHVDPEAINEQLEEVFGHMPVEIETIELCRRVTNFGVYEPFASDTFLSGQDQRMIVYVELDNFVSEKQSSEQYEVRLSQEIVLYNETDGLPVWQSPIETIVDQSRQRRNDFFTVKIIRLPARLGVGKYQLKVTINDLHGSTTASATVPVRIVADPALVSSETSK